MRVMAFCHASVGMADLSGNDAKGDAIHRQVTGVSMTENMKCCWWIDPGYV